MTDKQQPPTPLRPIANSIPAEFDSDDDTGDPDPDAGPLQPRDVVRIDAPAEGGNDFALIFQTFLAIGGAPSRTVFRVRTLLDLDEMLELLGELCSTQSTLIVAGGDTDPIVIPFSRECFASVLTYEAFLKLQKQAQEQMAAAQTGQRQLIQPAGVAVSPRLPFNRR